MTDANALASLPPALPGSARSLLLHAYLRGNEGYGRVAGGLGRGLEALGIPVSYLPGLPFCEAAPPDPWTLERLSFWVAQPKWETVIQLQVPETRAIPGLHKVAYTMTESDGLRPDQVVGLNESRLVIVPSRANVEWFQDSGVKPPIRNIPIALSNPDLFTLRDSPPTGPTLFGMAGKRAHGERRKNLQEGIDAFRMAFPNGQDVRLEVRAVDNFPLTNHDDPRITLFRDSADRVELADWYRSLDAAFFPARGEGWGMHAHEANACGVPAIACIWGGHADFLDPAENYPIDFELGPTEEPVFSGCWANPSLDSMVAQLRSVYDDRAEAARRGRLASLRAHAFTWTATASALATTLHEFGLLRST